MKLSPNLHRLTDFMDIILDWVPNNKTLDAIYEIHAHPEKRARCYAQISTSDETHYKIGLYRCYYSTTRLKPLKRTLRTFSTLDLLMTLAHEIAHLYEWKHTPYRQILECRIGVDLMERAIKLGYTSEEDEMGVKKVDKSKTYSLTL